MTSGKWVVVFGAASAWIAVTRGGLHGARGAWRGVIGSDGAGIGIEGGCRGVVSWGPCLRR